MGVYIEMRVSCGTHDFLRDNLSFFFFSILKDYRRTHPNVTVLDPPDAIQHVYSRQSMLQVVADLNLSDSYGNLHISMLVLSLVDYRCDKQSHTSAFAKQQISHVLLPCRKSGCTGTVGYQEGPIIYSQFCEHGWVKAAARYVPLICLNFLINQQILRTSTSHVGKL